MLSLIIMAWLNSLNDVHTFCHLLFDFHKSKEQKRWIWPIPFLINVFTALKGSQFSLSPAFSKKSGGTCFLTFRHSVRPSVRPSFRPPIGVCTLCAQLLLQFYSDSFETSQMSRPCFEDMHVVWILSSD